MSPAIKYTLGRLGLFVVVLALVSMFPLNLLVSGMIAIVVSAVLSFFLLAKWRNEMNEQLAGVAAGMTLAGLAAPVFPPLVSGAAGALGLTVVYCLVWFYGLRWLSHRAG